jgi:hypothetical protein
VLNEVLLRSMKQAVYAADNIGHFGLASTAYTHFTSPIRRYPDLLVHRLLRELVRRGRFTPARAEELEAALREIAAHCSARERTATEAEREVVSLHKTEYLARRVGETAAGFITGVTHSVFSSSCGCSGRRARARQHARRRLLPPPRPARRRRQHRDDVPSRDAVVKIAAVNTALRRGFVLVRERQRARRPQLAWAASARGARKPAAAAAANRPPAVFSDGTGGRSKGPMGGDKWEPRRTSCTPQVDEEPDAADGPFSAAVPCGRRASEERPGGAQRRQQQKAMANASRGLPTHDSRENGLGLAAHEAGAHSRLLGEGPLQPGGSRRHAEGLRGQPLGEDGPVERLPALERGAEQRDAEGSPDLHDHGEQSRDHAELVAAHHVHRGARQRGVHHPHAQAEKQLRPEDEGQARGEREVQIHDSSIRRNRRGWSAAARAGRRRPNHGLVIPETSAPGAGSQPVAIAES